MRKNNKSKMGASKHMSVKFNKFAQRNFKEYKNFVNTIVDCETQEVFTIDEKLGTIQEVSKMVAPLVIWENFKSLMETSGLICRKEDRISFGNAENVEFIKHIVENAAMMAYGKICQMLNRKPCKSERDELLASVSRGCMFHILRNA